MEFRTKSIRMEISEITINVLLLIGSRQYVDTTALCGLDYIFCGTSNVYTTWVYNRHFWNESEKVLLSYFLFYLWETVHLFLINKIKNKALKCFYCSHIISDFTLKTQNEMIMGLRMSSAAAKLFLNYVGDWLSV